MYQELMICFAKFLHILIRINRLSYSVSQPAKGSIVKSIVTTVRNFYLRKTLLFLFCRLNASKRYSSTDHFIIESLATNYTGKVPVTILFKWTDIRNDTGNVTTRITEFNRTAVFTYHPDPVIANIYPRDHILTYVNIHAAYFLKQVLISSF